MYTYYNTLPPLYVLTKVNNIIMDENNRIDGIKIEIFISIGAQDTTYDSNDEF